MIRKMLVIAAAVAMPATAMAGITAVGGAGIASAKALPPQAVTCTLSGTIAFPKEGWFGFECQVHESPAEYGAILVVP